MTEQSQQVADPFAGGPATEADPFSDAPDPAAEIAAEDVSEGSVAEGDLPVVNREGEPVQTAPETPEAVQEPPAAPAAAQEPPQAAQTGDSAAAEGGRGPRGGKGEMRYYKLLYQSAPKQWTEADLGQVTAEGIRIIKDDDGELWFEARNNEHANRLGFTIMNRPPDGARLFPIPKGAYKPKMVAPAPPKPERERVVIS